MHALADIRKVLDMDSVPLVSDGGTLVVNQEVHYNHVLMIPGVQTALEHCLRQCGTKPTVLDQRNPSD